MWSYWSGEGMKVALWMCNVCMYMRVCFCLRIWICAPSSLTPAPLAKHLIVLHSVVLNPLSLCDLQTYEGFEQAMSVLCDRVLMKVTSILLRNSSGVGVHDNSHADEQPCACMSPHTYTHTSSYNRTLPQERKTPSLHTPTTHTHTQNKHNNTNV